ncbi:MAG TPA: hypothetical protein PL072_01760 [Phycisphaerales bacterium]|nr:hypothetical protein [Phycisphaerales bacterium]
MTRWPARSCWALAAGATAALALSGCAARAGPGSPRDSGAGGASAQGGGQMAATRAGAEESGPDAASVILKRVGPEVDSVEPWSYAGRSGLFIRTRHYRLFTTQADGLVVDQLPRFLESALTRYRRVMLEREEEALPAPELRMDVMVFSDRAQWERFTRQLTGEQSSRLLAIDRGGYAWGGKGVLFDIGEADTYRIAAHEGWHQYAQRVFRSALPRWLDETIATGMEGHAWQTGSGGPSVVFDARDNPERRETLSRLVREGKARSLSDFLEREPPTGAGADEYYAHAWALRLFLEADPARREAVVRLLRDAAAGTLDRTVASALEARMKDRTQRTSLGERRGSAVFTAYLGEPEALDGPFAAFCRRLSGE